MFHATNVNYSHLSFSHITLTQMENNRPQTPVAPLVPRRCSLFEQCTRTTQRSQPSSLKGTGINLTPLVEAPLSPIKSTKSDEITWISQYLCCGIPKHKKS